MSVRRSSLFLTIFLWFMGAMVLMGAVTMGLTLVMTQQGILLTGREEILAEAVLNRGGPIIEQFEEEGARGLGKSIRERRDREGLFIHLFGPDGEPVTRDPFSRRIAGPVMRNLARGRTYFHLEDMAISLQRVASSSGREYILVGAIRVPSPWRFLGRNPTAFWIRLAGLVITAGIFCFFLARYITRPVRELKNAALSIVGGDLSVRVDERIKDRGDEIGQLGESFDSMTRHVSELLGAQNRLIRDISHELRSPLARLNVALALARRKADDELTGPLDRIERETENLNAMIGQLLSLSRLEADMGRVRMSRQDLASLVKHVVDDAHFEAGHQGKGVRLVSQAEVLHLEFNVELVRSAVENVVRNAVRHTGEGTAVEVELLPESGNKGSGTRVRVTDHGPGVPEEELENLFRPFYRLEDARDRRSGGTGLGLAIAWRAVHLHGGAITARNAPEGGLVVEIFLPEGKVSAIKE